MLVLFITIFAALLVTGGAPAWALNTRGHSFSFSFGEGHLTTPTGVAVNDTTGNVYVASSKSNHVDEFEPVHNGSGELTGETLVGETEVSLPQGIAVDNSTEATDPSKGDVYVVGDKGKAIFKLGPEGKTIGELRKFEEPGDKESRLHLTGIEGLAVGASGTLFVYETGPAEELILAFNDAVANEGVSDLQSTLPSGIASKQAFAVDSAGNFYTGVESSSKATKDRAAEELRHEMPVVSKLEAGTDKTLLAELDGEASTAVGVSPADGTVYLDNETKVAEKNVTTVAEFAVEKGSGGEEHAELIQRFSTPGLSEGAGVAIDPANNVYVTDAASNKVDVFGLEPPGAPAVEELSSCTLDAGAGCPTTAGATTLEAEVDPKGEDTHYYFEYGTAKCAAEPSPCVKDPATPADVGAGFANQHVSVELSPAPGTYYYRIVAENNSGTVDSAEQTFTVFGFVSGLPDGRAWEMVSPAEKTGAEPEPLGSEGGAVQASANGDAIAYVADGPMPAGSKIEGVRGPEFNQILSTRGSNGWSAEDITTANNSGVGIEVGHAQEYQLFSENLALALVEPFYGESGLAKPPLSPPVEPAEAGKQQRTIYLRDDAPEQVLHPEASEKASYEEARGNGEIENNAGFLALVTGANAPGGELEFGGGENKNGLKFVDATPDLSHVIFDSYKAKSGLYEWQGADKPLEEVSVLPESEGGKEVSLAEGASFAVPGERDLDHPISDNGSLVFWSTSPGNERHLYVRDTETHETLRLDTVQPGVSEEDAAIGTPAAIFQTASANGKKIFFTDTQRLTKNAKSGNFNDDGGDLTAPDLYVFELTSGGTDAQPLAGRLKDLTSEGIDGGSADVVEGSGGGVIGASEDGSYVYFVANGMLAPGAMRGGCEREGGGTTCNLYVRHYNEKKEEWEPTKLVAVLSALDGPDWGDCAEGQCGNLADVTARVSPDGRFLAFMSERSLTGYDNEDVTSKSPGERMDEEVFLYHTGSEGEPKVEGEAEGESLVCVSCNPTGARPQGVFDPGTVIENGQHLGETGEGIGLLVDRLQVWGAKSAGVVQQDHWLAGSLPGWTPMDLLRAIYQSRYLSNSGRLFFNNADALWAPGSIHGEKRTKQETIEGHSVEVGVNNVYEYEPTAVGGCDAGGGCANLISSGTSEHESAFLDASVNGNDVFFLTDEKLVPQDTDTDFDIYDAHVCEADSPCVFPQIPTKEHCEEEACQGSYSPGSTEHLVAASSPFSGSSNLVQQVQVLSQKETEKPKPKPLTRAQHLAKALSACRAKYKGKRAKSKRVACEKHARKTYGPVKKSASKEHGR